HLHRLVEHPLALDRREQDVRIVVHAQRLRIDRPAVDNERHFVAAAEHERAGDAGATAAKSTATAKAAAAAASGAERARLRCLRRRGRLRGLPTAGRRRRLIFSGGRLRRASRPTLTAASAPTSATTATGRIRRWRDGRLDAQIPAGGLEASAV